MSRRFSGRITYTHAQERYRKKSQDEVHPISGLYNIHKHINTHTVILCTNISIQAQT